MYLDNFNGHYMKEELSKRIFKDFIFFNSKINMMEVKDFLKCAFLFRSNLYNIQEVDIFGSSLLIPYKGLDIDKPLLLWRYTEAKVLKHTGIIFEVFLNKTRVEQEMLFNTCINIEINEKVNMQSVVDDMELGDLNNE